MLWKGETFTPRQTTAGGGSNHSTFGTAMVASSLLQAGAGIFAFGAARSNAKAQKAVTKANGEIKKTSIMREYTDLMEREAELVGSQKAIFAGAGHSWKNSVYQEAMFNSEENFLRNQTRQEQDLQRAERETKLGISSVNSQAKSKEGAVQVGTLSNLLGNYTTYKLFTR